VSGTLRDNLLFGAPEDTELDAVLTTTRLDGRSERHDDAEPVH
jgi:hypothetical protein